MPDTIPDTSPPTDLQALFAKLYNDVGDSNACDMFIQRLADGETIDDILSMSHKPVSIRTFIQDPYFMGRVLNNVWPSTIESVVEVIEGGYAEAIFTGSLGRAKTTRATIIAAYNLYVLSCYFNPQERLGLMPNSSLYIVMMNKTEALAKRVTYAKFRKLIERIPYFQKEFPFDKSVESEMRFANNIYVIPSVPNNDNLLGMDVVSGCFPPSQMVVMVDGSVTTFDKIINEPNKFLSVDETNFIIPSETTKVVYTGVKQLVSMTFDNGEVMVCTPDQRFKDENGEWVSASDAVGRYLRFSSLSDLQSVASKVSSETSNGESQYYHEGIQGDVPHCPVITREGDGNAAFTQARRGFGACDVPSLRKGFTDDHWETPCYPRDDRRGIHETLSECKNEDGGGEGYLQYEMQRECIEATSRPVIQVGITEGYRQSMASWVGGESPENVRPDGTGTNERQDERKLGLLHFRGSKESNLKFKTVCFPIYGQQGCNDPYGVKNRNCCCVPIGTNEHPVWLRDCIIEQGTATQKHSLLTGLRTPLDVFGSENGICGAPTFDWTGCCEVFNSGLTHDDVVPTSLERYEHQRNMEMGETLCNKRITNDRFRSIECDVSLSRCVSVEVITEAPVAVYDVENTGSTHTFFALSSSGKLALHAKNCIDEVNFYDYVQNSKRADDGGVYDQGAEVYHGLVTRIKTRFEGISANLRGCLSVVSSFKHSEDFTTRRIKEVEQMRNDGEEVYTYISTGSQWDFIPRFRPDGTPRFSETCFKVAIGNKKLKSEIIVSDDDALGREVIEVPDNFREQFKRNIEKALRDLAGRVSGSTGSYFSDPEIVWAAVEMWNSNRFTHLFNIQDEEEGWDLDNGYDILNKQFILRNPHIPRFLHLDLSLTNDWLGLAIGHSPNDKQRPTHIHQGKHELDSAPNVIYDGLLSIRPPKQGQIKYGELRKLIYYIVEKTRIPLKHVSCDGFQSADNLQILAQRLGVTTNVISTEGEIPFKTFKNAYEEGRIQHPNHPVYMGELLHLVRDEKTGRVDHTANRCFIGETMVLLQGGNQIMMKDMEYNTVYPVVSFDTRNDCFKVVDAVHPRITQYANELIEIEMGDGTTWQCTPDHLWLTSSGDWVKAEDLTPDDDILSLPKGLLKHD